MNRFSITAALFPAFFLFTAAHAQSYDLRLVDEGGRREAAISASDGDLFAIAVGGEEMDVLSGADAEIAFVALKEKFDPAIEIETYEGDAYKKRKIVIHKVDVDDDADAVAEPRETRTIRKSAIQNNDDAANSDAEHDAREDGRGSISTLRMRSDAKSDGGGESEEVIIGSTPSDEEAFRISLADELADLDAARSVQIEKEIADHDGQRRLIEIRGADAMAATDFIDGIDGLDIGEKIRMKSALGL